MLHSDGSSPIVEELLLVEGFVELLEETGQVASQHTGTRAWPRLLLH